MKKYFSLALFLLGCQIFAAPVELLKYGTFEDVKNNEPSGWKKQHNGAGKLEISTDAKSGKYAIRIIGEKIQGKPNAFYTGESVFSKELKEFGQIIPGAPNALYRISFWAKGKGAFRIAIPIYDEKKAIAINAYPIQNLTSSYKRYEYTFRSDNMNMKGFAFSVFLMKHGSDPEITFDDVSITFDPEENPNIDPGFKLPNQENIQALHRPQGAIGFINGNPPVIDGIISEKEYLQSIGFHRLFTHDSMMLQKVNSSVYIASDGEFFYIAARSEISPDGTLEGKNSSADGKENTSKQDTVEIFIDAFPAGKEDRPIYQHMFNFRKEIFTKVYVNNGSGFENVPWESQCITKSSIKDHQWHFEAKMPIAAYGLKKSDLKNGIGIRICRNFSNLVTGYTQAQIVSSSKLFRNSSDMPQIRWQENLPQIQHENLEIAFNEPGIVLSLNNPSSSAHHVQVSLCLNPQTSPQAVLSESIVIPPKSSKKLILKSYGNTAESTYGNIVVKQDNTILYSRDFNFSLQRSTASEFRLNDSGRAQFDFAFYPSKVSCAAEVSFLNAKPAEHIGKVKRISLAIKDRNKKIVATTQIPIVSYGKARLDFFALPVILPGEYSATISFPETSIAPETTTFQYRQFEWQGNKIGKSDILLPGFTPIVRMGRKVSVVLRDYVFNNEGLLNELICQGKNILAGPMYLEAGFNGKTMRIAASPIIWKKESKTQLQGESHYVFNNQKKSIHFRLEYDGFLHWQLEMPEKADFVRLIVPLKDEAVPFLNNVTDGIRHNYGGKMPTGQGVIWKSSDANRKAWPKGMVPYIWVGSEENGFCIAADSDKGWVNSAEVEPQQLIRENGVLKMVWNLAASQVPSPNPRPVVTIFFQASPVKPMPQNWRKLTFHVPYEDRDKNFDISFFSQYLWGTETPCLDVFPRNRDMSFLVEMKRVLDTGKYDEKYYERWLDGFTALYNSLPNNVEREKARNKYRIHNRMARIGLLKPKYTSYYTNARGIRFDTPEGQTYLNEWHIDRFPKRKWKYAEGDPYVLEPCESYRDYALFYFKQMADIIMDGIYHDCTILLANYNTTTTEAYRDEDGIIHPSCGFSNMRELIKRTSVMYREMEKPFFTMTHMTATSMTPIIGMGSMILGWEKDLGLKPYQERYSREYIRAVNIGRQSGCVPFCLDMLTYANYNDVPNYKKIFPRRTCTGVALTHEIKIYPAYDDFWKSFRILQKFGYGETNCTVYNYWNKDYPIHISGDTSSLLLAKDDELLLLVCDWGNGGTFEITIPQKFKFSDGNYDVVNLEDKSGKIIKSKNGKFQFSMRQYDYRIFRLYKGN